MRLKMLVVMMVLLAVGAVSLLSSAPPAQGAPAPSKDAPKASHAVELIKKGTLLLSPDKTGIAGPNGELVLTLTNVGTPSADTKRFTEVGPQFQTCLGTYQCVGITRCQVVNFGDPNTPCGKGSLNHDCHEVCSCSKFACKPWE